MSARENVCDMQPAGARSLASHPDIIRQRSQPGAKVNARPIITAIKGSLELLDSLDEAMRRIRIQAAGQPRVFLEELARAFEHCDAGLLRAGRELQQGIHQLAQNVEFAQSLIRASPPCIELTVFIAQALRIGRPQSRRRGVFIQYREIALAAKTDFHAGERPGKTGETRRVAFVARELKQAFADHLDQRALGIIVSHPGQPGDECPTRAEPACGKPFLKRDGNIVVARRHRRSAAETFRR